MTDDALHAFAPSAERAARLDARMHAELGSSLGHIADVLSDVSPEPAARLAAAQARLRAGARVGPETFATYYELGEAVIADRLAELPPLVGALEAGIAAGRSPLTVAARGAAGRIDAMLDARMGEEAAIFAPVPAASVPAFEARLNEGLALMRRALPDLAGEVEGIVHRVVVAQAPSDAKMQFDGASHYQFWGLLLLNPNFHKTQLGMVEVLAHEAGHSLLFGLTVDEPLVRNPDDELFASPLRVDPRPMDGIYHATFVSARMAWAMTRLAASDHLGEEDRVLALEAAEADRRNFAKGIGTVRAHGDLTETGERVMAGAEDAMREMA